MHAMVETIDPEGFGISKQTLRVLELAPDLFHLIDDGGRVLDVLFSLKAPRLLEADRFLVEVRND